MYSNAKLEQTRKEIDARKSLSNQQKCEYFDYFNKLEKRFKLNPAKLGVDASVAEITKRHHEINREISYKAQMAESLALIIKLHPDYAPIRIIPQKSTAEEIFEKFSFADLNQEIENFRSQNSEDRASKSG